MQYLPFTIIMTSCDRFDLLQRTLDSFFEQIDLQKYWVADFHIHNDSVNPVPEEIKEKYISKGITWHEGVKRGLSGAWDYLIELVRTEYILNLEDDWEFFKGGNKLFIEEAMEIMEKDSFIDQVWIRRKTDHNHPLKPCVDYDLVLVNGDWCGFSMNPSIRKLTTWKDLFPKGIAGRDEIELSREVKEKRYKAVALKDSAIIHIGGGRHTADFKI